MHTQQNSPLHKMHWVGVDVAKKTFDVALVRCGQKWPETPLASLPANSFQRTAQGVEEFLHWLKAQIGGDNEPSTVRVVMEATGNYSIELAAWLNEKMPILAPAIAPPHQTAAFIASMGLRNKTDRLEARALGFYGMERNPHPYTPMNSLETRLRDLVRYRDFLVQQRVAEGNRAEEIKHDSFVTKLAQKRLAQFERDINKIEQEMHKIIGLSTGLKEDIKNLCTIYGIGFIVAVTVRTELGDLRRFPKARQLAAYAGLIPSCNHNLTNGIYGICNWEVL